MQVRHSARVACTLEHGKAIFKHGLYSSIKLRLYSPYKLDMVLSLQCVVASLNPCANLCQFVCFAGSTFKAEDLSSLQIGDMKTKMLLGALTKLGKLRVQVDNGQIIGYRMDL